MPLCTAISRGKAKRSRAMSFLVWPSIVSVEGSGERFDRLGATGRPPVDLDRDRRHRQASDLSDDVWWPPG